MWQASYTELNRDSSTVNSPAQLKTQFSLIASDSGRHYGINVVLDKSRSTPPQVEPIVKNSLTFSYLKIDPHRLLELFLDRETDQGTRCPYKNRSQAQWFEHNSKVASEWTVIDPAAGPGLYAACLAEAGTRCYLGIEKEKAFVSFAKDMELPVGHRVIYGKSPQLLTSFKKEFNVSLLNYEILNSLSDSAIIKWLLSLRRILSSKAFLFGDFRAPSVYGDIKARNTLLYKADKGSVFFDFKHLIQDTLIYDETRLTCSHDICIVDSIDGKVIARYRTHLRLIVPDLFFELCSCCGYQVILTTELFPSIDAGFTLPSRSISFICQLN